MKVDIWRCKHNWPKEMVFVIVRNGIDYDKLPVKISEDTHDFTSTKNLEELRLTLEDNGIKLIQDLYEYGYHYESLT